MRYKITLTHEERAQLMQIIKKGGHKSQKVRRALILLNCDEGEYGEQERSTNEKIAKMLKVGLNFFACPLFFFHKFLNKNNLIPPIKR